MPKPTSTYPLGEAIIATVVLLAVLVVIAVRAVDGAGLVRKQPGYTDAQSVSAPVSAQLSVLAGARTDTAVVPCRCCGGESR